MQNNELSTAYVFDVEGWFNGTTAWQWMDGEYLKTPNATLESPWGSAEPSDDVFYRFNFSLNAWEEVCKPTCADELLGVWVDTESTTNHSIELLQLINKFEGTEGYKKVKDEFGRVCLLKIPKPSPEDIEASKIEQEMAELEAKIAALSDRMIIAMMQNDTEEIKQIQMEYAKLTEGANHEEVL